MSFIRKNLFARRRLRGPNEIGSPINGSTSLLDPWHVSWSFALTLWSLAFLSRMSDRGELPTALTYDWIEAYSIAALAIVAIASLANAFLRARPQISPEPTFESTDARQELGDALPHVVWGTSADGRCEFLNERYTETFGTPRLKAINDQSWADPIHPDDRPKMYQAWRAAVDSGSSSYSAHARVRMSDGSYRWMESQGRSVRSAESGEVAKWFGSLVDVQPQVEDRETITRLQFDLQTIADEYEKSLSRADERLNSLFEPREISWVEYDIKSARPLTDALRNVGVVDIPAYLETNPSRTDEARQGIRVYRASEDASRALGHENVPDTISQWTGADGVRNLDVETAVLAALLNRVTATCGITELVDAQGVTRTVPFSIWITEDGVARVSFFNTREVYSRAERASAARQEHARANRIACASALSTTLVHEMSQPLTAISLDLATAGRLVAMGPGGAEAVGKVMERLRWNIQRLTEIGTKTRESLRPNRHNRRPVDILELSRRSIDLVFGPLDLEDSLVEVSADSDLPLIKADPVALQQVLCALLLNAFEAGSSPDRPATVSLAISRPLHATEVRISISDSGSGIRDEHLALVFDPFFSTRPNRLGFGLTVCRSVVESFGGTLSLKNRSDGGAVAEFSIPMIDGNAFDASPQC
ncbi:PAS domain-containing sensor histidine kinase [Neorhizobium sp. BT27B]|uniref:ATP-binding protein n=1 Tax=Neorhizobium sp. BT27B TaxID=3142625 RepID=UPI003D2B63DC